MIVVVSFPVGGIEAFGGIEAGGRVAVINGVMVGVTVAMIGETEEIIVGSGVGLLVTGAVTTAVTVGVFVGVRVADPVALSAT